VLVLGDSVVAGHGVRDVRDTIPLKLERRLENRGVEVLNFGVGGYCTLAEVELLRVKGLRFQPDVVVVLFVANDFYDTNGQLGRYLRPRPGWTEWLFVNSHLYRTACMKFDWHGFRTELDPEEQARRSAEILGNNVERGLALLNRLASEHGFRCVMFIWPQFFDEQIGEAQYGPPVLHGPTRIEQIAAEHGIESHRLSRVFLSDIVRRSDELDKALSPSRLYTIGDGLHPSPTGAAVAADAMAEVISDPRWGL
jgi:lysophospholipase L1-like esterase